MKMSSRCTTVEAQSESWRVKVSLMAVTRLNDKQDLGTFCLNVCYRQRNECNVQDDAVIA